MSAVSDFFSVTPIHNTLHVALRGSWSLGTTQQYSSDYKREVGRYFAREWASVLDLTALQMLISEDEQVMLLRALNTWSYIKGMQAQCLIINGDCSSYLLYQFEEVWRDKTAFSRHVAASAEDAEFWLQRHGFSEKLELQSQKTA